MIEIRLELLGEKVKLLTAPVIAAGSVETVKLVCVPSGDRAGHAMTGYFIGADGVRYSQLFSGQDCIVPHEALAAKGWLRFSVAGVQNGDRIVSEETVYRITDSAYGEATGTTPPSPSQYEQLAAEIAALEDKAGMLSVDGNGRMCVSYEEEGA